MRRLGLKLRKRIGRLLLSLVVVLAIATAFGVYLFSAKEVMAQWFDGGWQYRKRLAISNSKVSDTHTNFPLLVSITDIDIKNNAQDDADDVVFTASDGMTRLDHEIESYNDTTGDLRAWVLLPELRDENDTDIYVYYGNPVVANQQSVSSVWETPFRGVFHLSDGSGTTANDVTASDNDLTLNSASWLSGAKIGDGWNGTGSVWLNRTDDNDFDFIATDNFSISMWVKSDSATNPGATQWVLNKSLSGGSQNAGYAIYFNTSGQICFGVDDDTTWGPDDSACSSTDVYDATWRYITAVKTGTSRIDIYVNGVSAGSDTSISATGTLANTRDLIVGDRQASDGTDEFAGDIDELRIIATDRSANWILTEYENQNDPSSFFVLSGTQEQMSTILNWKFDEGYGTTANDSTDARLSGTLGAGGSQPGQRSEDLCLYGKCLLFDGVDDYVSRTYDSSTDSGLDPGTVGFAVSMWFRHGDSISANETLVSRYNNGGYDLYMNTSGQICFRVAQNGTALASGDSICTDKSFYDNNWHFVKAIWDPDATNKQSIYITSSLEASSTSITQTGSKSGTSPTLYVGVGSNGTSNPFYGYIDDFKVYRESFTDPKMRADTASANYSEGASAVFGAKDVRESLTNGLVGYWRLDETAEGSCTGGVLDACDLSSASNHGEWEGTPSSTPAKFGRGLGFNNVEDYISVTDSSSLDVSSRFTLSAWIRPNDTGIAPLTIQRDGATTTSTAQAASSITFSHTVNTQSNQILVVTSGIEDDATTAITGITYNGVALTSSVNTTNSNRRAEIWYLLNPPTGTANVVITYAATVTDIIAGATNIYNAAQQAPTQTDTDTDDANRTESIFTPTNDYSAVIESVVNGNPTNNLDPQSSQTELYDSNSTNARAGAYFSIVEENVSTTLYVGATTYDNQAHVAAVFAPATSSDTTILLGKGRDAYQIELNASYDVDVYFSNSNTLSTTLNSNAYNHLVVSYDSVNATIYLNGELIQSVAVNQATGSNNTALTIGRYFDGVMDDVRIYNRPFSEYEVRYFYEWGPAPVSYFTLDEGDGNTLNNKGFSGAAASLTCVGLGCTNPEWRPGKYGKSLQFSEATGSYATLDSVGMSVDTREPFSISLWVYPDNIVSSQYETLFCDDNTSSQFCIALFGNSDTAARVDVCVDGGTCTSNPDSSDSVITERKWSHIVVTHDGNNTWYTYVDGIDRAGDLNAPSISDITDDNFYIGMYDPSGTPDGCDCKIDDIRIYNYTRTQKQVIADFNLNHPPIGGPVGAPITYWNFDEGLSTTVYSQGNCVSSCNASITNFSDPPTSSSGWTSEGKYDKALRFDGSNDYINVGNDVQTRVPNQVTLSAWIKPEVNNRAILSKWDTTSTSRAYLLFLNSSNQIEFSLSSNGNDSQVLTSVNTLLVDGSTWYHVVATYDGANMKLFIDGQADNSLARTGVIYESGESVQIGAYSVSNSRTGYFDGIIDEMRIYNYALNDSEIGQEFFKGATALIGTISTESDGTTAADSSARSHCVPGDSATCDPPRTHLRLDEKFGTTTNDASGLSNNGSHTGGTDAFFERGLFNNGVTFYNNAATRIALDSESQYDFTTGVTLSAWWRINSWQNSGARLMAKGTSAYYLSQNAATGALTFYTQGLSDTTLSSTTNVTDGVWRYITAVWDGSNKYIYIDGQIDATEAATGTMSTNNNSVTIGEDSNTGSGFFSAQVDEVKIYNYGRSVQQVNWDMNRGLPSTWWKFDDCTSTTAYDAGVVRANATVSIGSSGTYTSAGSCGSGSSTDSWYMARNGQFNSGIALDGTDDKVITSTSATVANFVQATISAWIYPTAYNANGAKIYHESTAASSSNARFELVLNSNGTLSFQGRAPDGDALTTWVTTSRTVPLNRWTLVTGVFNSVSDTQAVYIDKFQTTASVSEAGFTNSNPAVAPYIGAISSGTNTTNFSGLMDDVRLYPYALTELQVNLLLAGGGAAVFGPTDGLP